MAAIYEMREMPDIRKTGEKVFYPKIKVQTQINTDQLIERIGSECSLTPADLKAAISAISRSIATELAEGNSVKLDGIGTFSVRLGLVEGAERETADTDASHRNAQSIAVQGIHMRTDKRLVQQTNALCQLKRTTEPANKKTPECSCEEGLKLALEYLEIHPFLTVGDYIALTGKKHSTATKELRKLASDPGSGIHAQGRASHRVYVKTK